MTFVTTDVTTYWSRPGSVEVRFLSWGHMIRLGHAIENGRMPERVQNATSVTQNCILSCGLSKFWWSTNKCRTALRGGAGWGYAVSAPAA